MDVYGRNALRDTKPSLDEDLTVELPHRGQRHEVLLGAILYESTTLLSRLLQVLGWYAKEM